MQKFRFGCHPNYLASRGCTQQLAHETSLYATHVASCWAEQILVVADRAAWLSAGA